MAVADSTVLAIGGIGLSPYAARGITQTLEPIAPASAQRRTVNGALVNLAPPQFQKYKSTVTGNDQLPPAIDGLYPGAAVTVDCMTELSCPRGAEPLREAVEGSLRDEGDFSFYRPRLAMMVIGFNINRDEWGAVVSWTLDLEEV